MLRKKDPRTGEVVMLTGARAEKAVAAKRPVCEHAHTEIRKRTARNGSTQIKAQCQQCGEGVGNFLPKNDHPDAPEWDHELTEKFRARVQHDQDARIASLVDEEAVVDEEASQRDANWRRNYEHYLTSRAWAETRQKVLERANGLCEGCREAEPREVHHLTYKRVGRELLFDLVALCGACHRLAHPEHAQPSEWEEEEHCNGCRMSSGEDCIKFDMPREKALSWNGPCGPAGLGLEPLR